jgi:hypothetical protein
MRRTFLRALSEREEDETGQSSFRFVCQTNGSFFFLSTYFDLPHLFDPNNPTASLILFSLAVSWK